MSDSKPTYKHISELIRIYLEQYKDLYGNELYTYKKSDRKKKDS